MQKKVRYPLLLFVISLFSIIGLSGCVDDTTDTTDKSDKSESIGEPTSGGTLEVAFASDPDTIDWMYTGATATRDVGWHIFETLFALDNDFAVKPMIAESFDTNEEGTVYTIAIREGVNFHDGTVVTADDVVASIERWRVVSGVGKIASEHIDEVTANSEFEVEIKLKEPYHLLLADMAAPKQALMIIPAAIAEEAGEQPLVPEQLIGTGPYQFEKWERGNEILLSRFDDYAAREEKDWGGLTGEKIAYYDEVKFLIVKDPQVRINGLKTGLYDYAENISADLYEVLENTPSLEPVTYMNGYSTVIFDKSEAPFDDLKVRQALNHALDKQTIAEATYGNEQFFSLDGALFVPEQKALYSDKGFDQYLAFDREKAKSLLEESTYNGDPITIMYSNNNEGYKKISQVAKQQLEEVGFKVELDPYEWATYLERWQEPGNWDLVVVGWSTRFSPNELGMLGLETASSGWYDSQKWADSVDRWGVAETEEEQKEILTEMNQVVNDELPFVKVANETRIDIKSDKVNADNWLGQRHWNAWKSE